MAWTLSNLIEKQTFDAVHADQLWMAPYALQARQMAQHTDRQLYSVLDQHNAVYLIPGAWQKASHNPLALCILRREARLMARADEARNLCTV